MKAKTETTIGSFSRVLSIGTIGSLICLSSANARPHENYNLNERAAQQQQHAEIGLRSGALTRGEATRIKSHLENIDNTLKNDRATNNGKLTEAQRDQTAQAQNAAAKKIYQLKHNQNTTVPAREVSRVNQQRQRVEQAVQSGRLTQTEAATIKSHEENIKDNLQKAANNGGLSKSELKTAQSAQERAAHRITRLERKQKPTDQE